MVLYANVAAGGFAGVFSWLFTYPIDFLKSRLQVRCLLILFGVHSFTSEEFSSEYVNSLKRTFSFSTHRWRILFFFSISDLGGWSSWITEVQRYSGLYNENLPDWRDTRLLPWHGVNAHTLVSCQRCHVYRCNVDTSVGNTSGKGGKQYYLPGRHIGIAHPEFLVRPGSSDQHLDGRMEALGNPIGSDWLWSLIHRDDA